MSNHDYTKHSNKNAKRPKYEVKTSFSETKPAEVAPVAKPVPVAVPELVTETVETVSLPAGRVVNCTKLNVREHPSIDADVVCEIVSDTEVVIDPNSSTNEFYKVCTEHGIEGYCMKKYIKVKP